MENGVLMGIFDCLKSERAQEINRLVEKKRYSALYYQCGYDTAPAFSDALLILSGPPEQYDRLTSVIARDKTGIVGDALLSSSALQDHIPPSDKAAQELFVYGIHALARERSATELTVALHQQGFSDPLVMKEIMTRRTGELTMQGLSLIADSFGTAVRIKDTRTQYIHDRTCELDKMILATQREAMDAVKDQLATAPDYLTLLAQKRDELKKPYEERKANLGEEFDNHLVTALDHMRNGRVAKAYTMLAAVNHDVTAYIAEGIREVCKQRAPSWLLGEILKQARFNAAELSRAEVQVFYRPSDYAFVATVTHDGATRVRESYEPSGRLKEAFSTLLDELQKWQQPDVRNRYVDIGTILRRLSDDAKSRPHRD